MRFSAVVLAGDGRVLEVKRRGLEVVSPLAVPVGSVTPVIGVVKPHPVSLGLI